MYSLELSNILRNERPVPQFCDAGDFTNKGLHKGATFSWNLYSGVARQCTTLTETSTVNETNFAIAQGTSTVAE